MEKTLQSILEQRKSIRKFTGEQIRQEELETILEAANAAPVAMKLYDSLKIIVIQNQELIEQLDQNTVRSFEKFRGPGKKTAIFHAPTLILIAAKSTDVNIRQGLYCTAACMLENMILTATDLKLGNVYLMGVTMALNQNETLKEKVGISKEYEAVSALALGKTDVPFTKRNLSLARFQIQKIQ